MNRLAQSLSPYLLQHRDNPVDWYPWCDEAFERAEQTDRPIFLSVGYAACHWCHVMAHESFENDEIAAYLNEHFVSIKVDREERPDIDQIYMNAVQLMTGHGGWPMSVFLGHDRRPFYAGTYWPPVQRFNMPGFPQVLEALVDAWTNRREEIEKHSGQVATALQQLALGTDQQAETLPDEGVVTAATHRLLSVLDRTHGGFDGAPKFPHASDIDLLLRRGATTGNDELIEAAELTLDAMAAGGIRDHLGGGFARYSVDAQWLVPHFEKMLYDNALLGLAYVRAFQVTGHPRHAQVARETFDYLCRDMVDSAGGFHCSEDADSEGVEGKFYVWKPAEVHEVLPEQRAGRFCQIYDITEGGNFEGSSIPHLSRSLDAWAGELGIGLEQLSRELAEDREALRQARERRVRPGRDDKVLTAWNALAIEALAVGGAVLDEPRYLPVAETAAGFLHTTLRRDDGRLLHAYRDGTAHQDGFLDDYAYTTGAYLALFEATGHGRWVERAVELADAMIRHFDDPERGGFYYTADDAEALIARTKDWHDGSLISGNAAAALALLKLSRLCDRDDYRTAAERTLRAGSEVMTKQAAACGALLAALDRYHHDTEQLVLAVADLDAVQRQRPNFLRRFRPHTTLSWVVDDRTEQSDAVALNRGRATVREEPTLYRCEHFTCDQPIVGEEATEWLGTQ